MAMQGTHIRFAADLRGRYQPSNYQKYITGALYPDSRLLTITPRAATHPPDFMEWDVLALDDFKKGWHTHLLADRLQHDVIREHLPEIYATEPMRQGDESWVSSTAIKILQDLHDISEFNPSSSLPSDMYVKPANSEDAEALKRFYALVRKTYSGAEPLDIYKSCMLLAEVGFNHRVVESVQQRAKAFQHDPKIMELVPRIYPDMLNRAAALQ